MIDGVIVGSVVDLPSFLGVLGCRGGLDVGFLLGGEGFLLPLGGFLCKLEIQDVLCLPLGLVGVDLLLHCCFEL